MSEIRPILILGAHGQVGRALLAELGAKGLGLSRENLDLSQPRQLGSVLMEYRPLAILNAAAYTQVDRAETESGLAETINGVAPGVLAEWCLEKKIPFIHYSTDYIFPGTGTQPWREDDLAGPVNHYGRSKLEGERASLNANPKSIILRTSWVYDSVGKNFLTAILKLAQERKDLRIVSDQVGAPTYAPHLAWATLQILNRALLRESASRPQGIYHLANQGVTTWFGFAQRIIELGKQKGIAVQVQTLEPILTADYASPAKRPQNSRLDMSRFEKEFGVMMPRWEMGLEECMGKIK